MNKEASNIKNLEVACFNFHSALNAIAAGASRIEFCSDYKSGGLSPDPEEFTILKEISSVPVYVMIRPRRGDFVYSSAEIKKMQELIKIFTDCRSDGFVFGILTPDGKVDIEANSKLIIEAGKLPCTFHRAFDYTAEPFDALEDIIQMGFKNILSSGRQKTALLGADFLSELKKRAKNKISFIAGGGVRSKNIDMLVQKFETDFYHTSAITGNKIIANMEEIKKILAIINP